MLKRDEAAALLHQGHSPSRIAVQMKVRASEVMSYLYTKIGAGELRRSDIAFSLPSEVRQAIEEIIDDGNRANSTRPLTAGRISRELQKKGVACDRFDVRVYVEYRRAGVVLGDMYEIVRNIEVRLHRFIKRIFIAEYGEDNWWRSGVPEKIRAECAALLEKDPEPASEPYCYTHLIALREILDRGWAVFNRYLPAKITANKKELLDRLLRLNRIRNAVMHPVRGENLTEEEFEFVYQLEADLGLLDTPAEALHTHPADDPEPSSPSENTPTDRLKSELVSRLAPAATEDDDELIQDEGPAAATKSGD